MGTVMDTVMKLKANVGMLTEQPLISDIARNEMLRLIDVLLAQLDADTVEDLRAWITEYEGALASIGIRKDLETLDETGEMSWLYETDGGPEPAASVAEALQETMKLKWAGE